MGAGPIVVGYDGSPSSERALSDAVPLFFHRPVLVVTVWEPGLAMDLAHPMIPPAPIDIRAVLMVDEVMYERAQQLAEHGAAMARLSGATAEGLAVADERSVAETLIRVAEEQDAGALVVGIHGHHVVREFVLGSTTQHLIHHAPCPVMVRQK